MQTCKVKPADQPQASRALAADWALSGTAESQCAIPGTDRVDCGYPEVTPEDCKSRGCCFDSSIPEVPWCFKPLQDTGKPGLRVHTGAWAGHPVRWPSVDRGLSQRLRAQGSRPLAAAPCCPAAERFVQNTKAIVSKRCQSQGNV